MAIDWGSVFGGGKAPAKPAPKPAGRIDWGSVFASSKEPDYFAKARANNFDYKKMQKEQDAAATATAIKALKPGLFGILGRDMPTPSTTPAPPLTDYQRTHPTDFKNKINSGDNFNVGTHYNNVVNQSLLDGLKEVPLVGGIIDQGAKVYHTVNAAQHSLANVEKAAVGIKPSQKDLTYAINEANKGYLSPEARQGNIKSFAKDIIKGGTELAPYFTGLGKGASLVKVLAFNAGLGGLNTANQAISGDKVDWKTLLNNVAMAEAQGLITHGTSKVIGLLKNADTKNGVARVKTGDLTSYEGAPDRARVDYWKKQIQAGNEKPIIVAPDSTGKLGIEDGKHRYQAYQELGYKNVPVDVNKSYDFTVKQQEKNAKVTTPTPSVTTAPPPKPGTLKEAVVKSKTPPPELQAFYDKAKSKGIKNPETLSPHELGNAVDPEYLMSDSIHTDGMRARDLQQEYQSRVVPQGKITGTEPTPATETLTSGLNPGADKLIQQDIVPKAKGAIEGTKNVVRDTKSVITPASVDQNAADASLAVRKYKAGSNNAAAIEAANGKTAHKFFNRQSDQANIENISSYEKTGKFANEPTAGYSEAYKASTDYAHNLNKQTYGDNAIGYIDNYVRRNWIFGSEAEAQKAISALSSYQKTLAPSKANLKERTLDMPLSEAQKVLQERGIQAKLNTTNPELLRQQTVTSAEQAAGYKAMGENLKSNGLITFAKTGQGAPDGMVPLNDRAFQVLFPTEQGLTKSGQYYAPPSVAKILNNSISSGLEGNALYRGIRNVKNNFNLLQLGVSAFHGGTTTLNASINDMVLGMRNVLSGHPVRGLGEIGRGIVPAASVIRQTYLGSKAFKDFRTLNPEAAKVLESQINPAGFRLRMENRYKTTVTENMIKAFHNNNPIGGILRIPGSVIEQSTRPIMEHLVPNAKLGAFMDRAAAIQERMPNATPQQLARELAKASDSMDNIYGQLVYDNLFWNKTFKDIAMLTQRSVGWNLGTIREVGGGITDVATKTLRGKGVSDKTLFAATLPLLVGTYGAVYQYLHTGKGPESLLDYFYPKNGLTNKNGEPDRISLPSYMKDAIAYAKDPKATIGHKLAPQFSILKDLITNKDYFNNMVRNPNDSLLTQLEQSAKYTAKQTLPFSVQQFNKVKSEGGGLAKQLESFAGIVPAPGSVEKSKFANDLQSAINRISPKGSLTPEEAQAVANKPKQGSSLERSFDYLSKLNRAEAARLLKEASPKDLQGIGDIEQIKRDMAYTIDNKNSKQSTKDASWEILRILGADKQQSDLSRQKKQQIRDKAKASRKK